MKTFQLTGTITVSVYTNVEAESLNEAIRIAEDRTEVEALKWGDADQSNQVWVNEEYDGALKQG